MRFAYYFIDRPIFASVLSILILLGGFVAMLKLPITEYPEITPPVITVSAFFPGANPSEISETVAAPLEEQINGIEKMLYMNSLASSDGVMNLKVTFEIGTDPDHAQQLVQNKVSQALPRLPSITRQLGVTVNKSSPDLTMVVHILSPKDQYDMLFLRNYSTINIKDELVKIKGVGKVSLIGSGDYAMRVWLNPDKISELNLNASDIVNSIKKQNLHVAGGGIGGAPYDESIGIQFPINISGRLNSVKEFEDVIVKRDSNGVITRLKDLARIEIDAQSYALRSLLNGKKALAIPIFAAPKANALQISASVRETMARLKSKMPDGIDYQIVYDPTSFVKKSISSVVVTLLQATLLVSLVVVIFLQAWRASIITLLAVPISIIGTFIFMLLCGFSINTLTLFGLILAIGIVVDDAIVVVENVERNITNGKKPREATIQAMKEVSGPIIATTLVLAGVFIPIAFISGLTGQFYRQFSITIAIATFISTINSLTLSPALAALLLGLKKSSEERSANFMISYFSCFLNWFNYIYNLIQCSYDRYLIKFIKHRTIMVVIYVFLLIFIGYSFIYIPKEYIPIQDKGYLVGIAVLPPGATLDRTEGVIRQMDDIIKQEPGIDNSVQFPGLSINGLINSPNSGIIFVNLESIEKRNANNLSSIDIANKLRSKFNSIEGAFIAIFPPPTVQGIGNIGGFKLQIQDRSGLGIETLDKTVQSVLNKARKNPALTGMFSNYNVNFPQILTEVNRTKAERLGISIEEIFRTMQIYFGSLYVNDFTQSGRAYQVIAQADKRFRSKPTDINRIKVRNLDGDMVPLGVMVNISESFGPETFMRYNAFPSADINGNVAHGYSSDQAHNAISSIMKETLPEGMTYEWTELKYQQILSGNTAIIIFPICILLIFLILAAYYESLSVPISIILIVPIGILFALIGLWVSGCHNNVFTQIALFVLAGLACKNAILVVEFAKELELRGISIVKSAITASKIRFRPILMTSVSFIAGVLPLMFSSGAGSEMRQTIGLTLFYGMAGVMLLGLIYTPVFYIFVRKIESILTKKKEISHEL